MKLHIITKIRITIILALAAGITWMLNRQVIFTQNNEPVNFIFSHNYLALMTLSASAIGATVIAYFLGGKNTKYIAPLAGPFTVLLPAIFSDNMNELLVNFQGTEARASMFKMMFIDSILWYIPILASLATAVILNHTIANKNKIKVTQPEVLSKSLSQAAIAAIASSIIAIFLIPIFCQGDSTMLNSGGSYMKLTSPVSIGQQAFGVTAAFFLSILACNQFFRTTGKAYIPVPIIVAGYFYLHGNHSVWNSLTEVGISPLLLPPTYTSMTILPITFAVFGSIGIAWGYWNSYKLHFARENNLIKVK